MIIHEIEDKDIKSFFVNYNVKTFGADCLVIIPGGAEYHVLRKNCHDHNLSIEPRVSLCVKNGYGSHVVISMHDSITEAEAARLQFIHDYCNEENEFKL